MSDSGEDRASSGSPPHTPRWVKVSALVALVVVLLIVALLVFGGGRHGPGRHGSSGSAPVSGGQEHAPPQGGHR